MSDNKKKYQPLILPTVKWGKENKVKDDLHSTVTISPLEIGFGNTFGNSIRRMLLGGIEGSAITSIIIDGVNNECSVISGVVDDTMSIILNLKQVLIKNHTGESGVLEIERNEEGDVLAGDFFGDDNLEIINKDFLIARVAKGGSFKLKAFVESGRGYQEAKWPKGKSIQEDNRIFIDSVFAPVKNVFYNIEKTRVGSSIDNDKLVLDITTDGTITPKEAYEYSISVLLNQFNGILDSSLNEENEAPVFDKKDIGSKDSVAGIKLINEFGEIKENFSIDHEAYPYKNIDPELFLKSIDFLGLSARAHNCLLSAGVQRVIDLVNFSKSEISSLKNFGKKSFDDLVKIMKDFNLSFEMNVSEEVIKNILENK